MYTCECGKQFEKAQSLNAHYSHCLIHRKGKPETRKHVVEKCMSGWDKFSQQDRSEIAKKSSKSFFEKGGKRILTDETKMKISESSKGKTGGYREGTNKWKGGRIFCKALSKDVWLDSKWEIKFVEILEQFSIEWVKNYKSFEYDWEFSTRKYIPDFFLPEFDLWIEVKGWEKEIDKAKWKSFPHRLKIIRGEDLKRISSLDKTGLVLELVDKQD
jgi:hypothetical protein